MAPWTDLGARSRSRSLGFGGCSSRARGRAEGQHSRDGTKQSTRRCHSSTGLDKGEKPGQRQTARQTGQRGRARSGPTTGGRSVEWPTEWSFLTVLGEGARRDIWLWLSRTLREGREKISRARHYTVIWMGGFYDADGDTYKRPRNLSIEGCSQRRAIFPHLPLSKTIANLSTTLKVIGSEIQITPSQSDHTRARKCRVRA